MCLAVTHKVEAALTFLSSPLCCRRGCHGRATRAPLQLRELASFDGQEGCKVGRGGIEAGGRIGCRSNKGEGGAGSHPRRLRNGRMLSFQNVLEAFVQNNPLRKRLILTFRYVFVILAQARAPGQCSSLCIGGVEPPCQRHGASCSTARRRKKPTARGGFAESRLGGDCTGKAEELSSYLIDAYSISI